MGDVHADRLGLERVMRSASAAWAFVASRFACSDAMPTATESDELMEASRA